MTQEVSRRIIDQRIRNRIIGVVEILAGGPEAVTEAGFQDYFENFYDWIPYGGPISPNSALSDDEYAQLSGLGRLLDQACDDTPQFMTAREFIDTGWPDRIQPHARHVLAMLVARGRFDEEREEEQPSRWSR